MLRIRVTFIEENLFEIKFEITVFETKKRSRHPFRSTRFRESRYLYSRHQAFSNQITTLLLASGKRKNIQSRNLKFVFTASFQAWILSENFEILKYKIYQEIITLISFLLYNSLCSFYLWTFSTQKYNFQTLKVSLNLLLIY